MRLVSFRSDSEPAVRVGEIEGERVCEVQAASMPDWLAGSGRERTGAEHALVAIELLAPVPEPPSLRDFYAYEGHAATGARLRGRELARQWYEAPAFYFSNPASIHGPAATVARPPQCRLLDFELEIAAIVGRDGGLAGFTLMNDWSARDLQANEMAVGLGPHKGKDFATSLGPWLVTPDELPYEDGRLHLEASVTVNGRPIARSDASLQHFGWPEILAHAARDTRLRPGDVLGSGTLTGGCLLELGPLEGGRFLEPGDVVALSAPGLGTLENHVG